MIHTEKYSGPPLFRLYMSEHFILRSVPVTLWRYPTGKIEIMWWHPQSGTVVESEYLPGKGARSERRLAQAMCAVRNTPSCQRGIAPTT